MVAYLFASLIPLIPPPEAFAEIIREEDGAYLLLGVLSHFAGDSTVVCLVFQVITNDSFVA